MHSSIRVGAGLGGGGAAWQRAWEGLIFSLSAIQTNQTQAQRDEQAEPILDQFTAEIRAINADQARLASKREQNQYPNCAQIEPQR